MLALLLLALVWNRELGPVLVAIVAVVLVGAVLVAVHHAEVVAHRVGEPFGSLILAVAVTIIEVGLILSITASGGPQTATLARDTVFAAIMITCTGIVGLPLLVGAVRHHVVEFQAAGSGGAFAAVITLATLCLVFPAFTTSSPGPTFATPQLVVRRGRLHRALRRVRVRADRPPPRLLPPRGDRRLGRQRGGELRAPRAVEQPHRVDQPRAPARVAGGGRRAGEGGVARHRGRGHGRGGAALGGRREIALLVLLPETLAAINAAARDRLQTSFNLAYGSALASIGLTIPAIAVASIWIDGPLLLGLSGVELVLLAVTAVVGSLTVGLGSAMVLGGVVHLVIFAAFLFVAVIP